MGKAKRRSRRWLTKPYLKHFILCGANLHQPVGMAMEYEEAANLALVIRLECLWCGHYCGVRVQEVGTNELP